MRSLTLLVVASLALAVPTAAEAAPQPKKPKADLVTQTVTGTLTGGMVSLSASTKNKGKKKSGKSATSFRLSKDATASADDVVLASVATRKLKPKKKVTVTATVALPPTVAPGSYRVLACADSAARVKEKKEANNCKAGSTILVPTPIPAVTVAFRSAGLGGSPFASITTSVTPPGTCSYSDANNQTGSCTTPGGSSTVTLTAVPQAPFTAFTGWTADAGGVCTGVTSGATITISSPAVNQACVANFVPTA